MKLISSFLDPFRRLSRPGRLFLLAIFLDGLLFAGWNLFFNLYILESGYSREFLGLVTAAPSLSALVLGVPLGLLSDRLGRKLAMIAGFIVANFAIIGMILGRSEWLILVMGCIFGLGGQLYMVSQAPFMMKVSDDKTRDSLFSFSFGMFPLANTAGNFIAGYLPGSFTRWFHLNTPAEAYQAVLLFSVLSSFLVLVPIVMIKEPHLPSGQDGDDNQKGRMSVWKVILKPLTIKLSLPNLIIGFGAATLIPYFNVYFVDHYGMSDADLGILFSLAALVTGVACLIGPRIVGNLGGKIRTVVLGQTLSLVFLLMIGFSPWSWLAGIGLLMRGALMNMVAPLFDAYSLEQCPESEHGTVNSIRNLAFNLGWAVGPYLSGLVQERWGFTPLFINTAVLYSLGICLTWIFFRPGIKDQPKLIQSS